ncbi:MAG: hypothetical protein LRZ94_01320 [Candidatus Pacebacteria bacterium]|nr:hypothetical protein [Candidatus Paceibacterota bacterium]
MNFLTYINRLRVELKDFGEIQKDVWDGDGSTKNFPASRCPIKEGSYTVEVGGVVQTENTDYSLNRDTGLLTFTTAPVSGSDNVEMTYQVVKIRDEDYLEIINDGIDHFRWKFWNEAEDETAIKSVKDQNNYDLSSLTGILYLTHAWYKTSGATQWTAVQSTTNWKYLTRQKTLFIDPPFSSGGLSLKFRYLKELTKGTSVSDTMDIPSEWLLPFKFYAYARFYERLISEKIHETAAITTIPTYAPAQLVFSIAEGYYRKAEEVANKLAPKMPPLKIKQLHAGISL